MLPLAISADGRHLAVSVEAQRVQVWDLAALRLRLRELGLDWEDRGKDQGSAGAGARPR
jgi:fructose-1,6-bisphosphatase/inositol monophosphatase family enzyme